jgi:site-specific DNA-cytosine methylase
MKQKKSIRYLSFFSGIGGFEYGLQTVFGNDAKCLGFSEVDKNAITVYKKHFPNHHNLGDITKIDFEQFQDVDLIVAGSPCQDLSNINMNGKGLQGLKSKLFFEFIKALQIIKPRFFVLENVYSMNQFSKDEISRHVEVEPVLVNSACFGAQDRKRWFWANFAIQEAIYPSLDNLRLNDVLDSKSLVKNNQLSEKALVYMTKPYGNSNRLTIFGDVSDKPKSRTVLASPNIPSHVIIDKRFKPALIRTYTITELEKLQNFPPGWVSKIDISNTAKTRAIGNALNGNVSIYVFEQLQKWIKDEEMVFEFNVQI